MVKIFLRGLMLALAVHSIQGQEEAPAAQETAACQPADTMAAVSASKDFVDCLGVPYFDLVSLLMDSKDAVLAAAECAQDALTDASDATVTMAQLGPCLAMFTGSQTGPRAIELYHSAGDVNGGKLCECSPALDAIPTCGPWTSWTTVSQSALQLCSMSPGDIVIPPLPDIKLPNVPHFPNMPGIVERVNDAKKVAQAHVLEEKPIPVEAFEAAPVPTEGKDSERKASNAASGAWKASGVALACLTVAFLAIRHKRRSEGQVMSSGILDASGHEYGQLAPGSDDVEGRGMDVEMSSGYVAV